MSELDGIKSFRFFNIFIGVGGSPSCSHCGSTDHAPVAPSPSPPHYPMTVFFVPTKFLFLYMGCAYIAIVTLDLSDPAPKGFGPLVGDHLPENVRISDQITKN